MKLYCKTVYLPHLDYTVRFKQVPAHDSATAWVTQDDKWSSTVHLTKSATVNVLAHELVHVLKNICIGTTTKRNNVAIRFEDETEHMGYIMDYLMCRALGIK